MSKPNGKKLSLREAAIQILKESRKPISAKEIYELASSKGLIGKSKGKTPAATLGATMYTHPKEFKKSNKAKFVLTASEKQKNRKQKTEKPAAK